MILLSEKDVDTLLTVEMAIESAVEAYCAFSDRSAVIPLRAEVHRKKPHGIMLAMPGLVGDTIGIKVNSSVVVGGEPDRRTTAMLLIWDATSLTPRGLISANRLNDHRTAAGFAAATRVLARPDSRTHVIFGAGKLGFVTALYIAAVLPLERIILCNRTLVRAEALAARLRNDPRFAGIDIRTDIPSGEAVAQADVITTVTRSDTPVFDGRLVREGTHINLGGANKPHQREMDDNVASRATFWVDSEEGCFARGGDVIIPLGSAAIAGSQIKGEIGLSLSRKLEARSSASQVTAFKSLGIATQDLVLAARILDEAEKQGAGQTFDHIGGGHA